MAVDVGSFSAQARMEFLNAWLAAAEKPVPAQYQPFTTVMSSSTKVETHTYMNNLPRLARFKGYSPGVRLEDNVYTVTNYPYRIGPITVKQDDLDDDQLGGYMRTIQALPGRAQKDIGATALDHLAAGETTPCFDGTNLFANSHTFGTGDNLDTANFASNDGVTHKVIALVLENPVVKPIIFQDRTPLGSLETDADTPQAKKLREYEYWADARFGLGYGFWFDCQKINITDTPTVAEVIETLIPQIINNFRTFTLPKGRDTDSVLYVHEGWNPSATNLYLLCNLKLGEILDTAVTLSQYIRSTGNTDNVYKGKATIVPTSALGA